MSDTSDSATEHEDPSGFLDFLIDDIWLYVAYVVILIVYGTAARYVMELGLVEPVMFGTGYGFIAGVMVMYAREREVYR